jgi:glycosyltransferase involved in cell wall biosynthesis
MLNDKKVVVVPAYNAARTLRRTVDEIPWEVVGEVILSDDASRDGSDQKTCHTAAPERGADIVVMLHPDYQYTPKLVSVMTSMIANGEYDSVLASRIQGRGALKGGMPLCKYISNRGLTCIENMLIQEDAEISHRLPGLEPPLAGEATREIWIQSTGYGSRFRAGALGLGQARVSCLFAGGKTAAGSAGTTHTAVFE